MVIGDRFAWGHLEKTGGDATVELFLALPELIRFADPLSSEEKHTAFADREPQVRGKLLVLNMRRLPGWVLSRALHQARYGAYPEYEPLPMKSPQEMAESQDADRRLREFTQEGRLPVDRWLRMEFLGDDFLAFVSEMTELSEARQREIRELAGIRRGTPLLYDHRIEQWFTPDQVRTMYERNPLWAAVERGLYGPDELNATGPASPPARVSLPTPPDRTGGSAPMSRRELLGRKAERAIAERSQPGDFWDEEPSALEEEAHRHQVALLATQRYRNVLEIGCGPGRFTRRLAEIADRVVAVDVAPVAIARARASDAGPATVEFRLANVMDLDLRTEPSWDLVVLSETIYELGWLYPLFDVSWLASELFAATAPRGRLLMANTYASDGEHLLSPWLIETYRDLFLNVGYLLNHQETAHGTRDGVDYATLITLFSKPAG
jgi:SAM-dependent methyltransferase